MNERYSLVHLQRRGVEGKNTKACLHEMQDYITKVVYLTAIYTCNTNTLHEIDCEHFYELNPSCLHQRIKSTHPFYNKLAQYKHFKNLPPVPGHLQ